MKYEEYKKRLVELQKDVEWKKKRLNEAETELEVWEDYRDNMIEKGRGDNDGSTD